MMTEKKDSCVKPSQGPILSKEKPIAAMNERVEKKEDIQMTARVGKPAIDFEASAYLDGGFKNIRLSDYKGKWILVCFYPGDFTFV